METVGGKKISIFQPKKDQCDVCCEYRVGNIAEDVYKAHEKLKTEARDQKEADKERAERDECQVYTNDLQQVKLAPALMASALYYKTKLCVHNHTFFNLTSREVCCYWWDESEGEVKAANFTSCVIDFLKTEIEKWPLNKNKHIILWTDGCVYQNKNKTLGNALLHLSLKYDFLIEQKYLHKGHTQMEADSVHAAIERRLKNREIHHPHDYLAVTRESRINLPYNVKSVDHRFFLDYEAFEIYSSLRPGNMKDDPTVNDVVQYTYKDGSIYYKLRFSEDLRELPQRKKEVAMNLEYNRLYRSRIRISAVKYQHLQELKKVLPAHVWEFYDNIPHQEPEKKKKTENIIPKTVKEQKKQGKKKSSKK